MDIEKIAFDHLLEKLSSQRDDIMKIRGQASISAAVTGLIATFFANTLDISSAEILFAGSAFWGFSIPALIVLTLIASSLAFSVLVVVGWNDFTFSFDTEKMLAKSIEFPSERDFLASYEKDGEWFFRDNETKIRDAQTKLWWAMVLGWAQIIPWVVIL